MPVSFQQEPEVPHTNKGFFNSLSNFTTRAKESLFGADDDDGGHDVFASSSSVLAAEKRGQHIPNGIGYELGFRQYMRPNRHNPSWYFVSQLGDPFPSYHSLPDPFFPPRWTCIPHVRVPCESITAPRIRLAPNELEKSIVVLEGIGVAAAAQTSTPKPKTLNLSHQCLGDPYQYQSLRTMLQLNSTVEILNLDNNELEDISLLPIANVKRLYLARNNFTTMLCLPQLPLLEELILIDNFISGTLGLSRQKYPKLRKLCVSGNPIEVTVGYRDLLVAACPTLQVIDMYLVKR